MGNTCFFRKKKKKKKKKKQMNASYQASLVNRHIRRFTGTLDFKILTQCVKMLGERVLQVWR